MADRRMFSKRIVESARFIKMPSSTQALYFHLGLHADDDGVVEGYNIMLQTGSTEDDLKLLVAKGFITVLNEDLVVFVNDWKENNRIRADRKVDSIYKNLLISMLPQIELQKPKVRADTGKFAGRPMDNQWTAQDRLGKDRLSKDRKTYSPAVAAPPLPYREIVDYLNQKAGTKYRSTTKKTQSLIKARYHEKFTLDDFKKVIDNKVAEWKSDNEMAKYLRPETLFGTKFESYLNQKEVGQHQSENPLYGSAEEHWGF